MRPRRGEDAFKVLQFHGNQLHKQFTNECSALREPSSADGVRGLRPAPGVLCVVYSLHGHPPGSENDFTGRPLAAIGPLGSCPCRAPCPGQVRPRVAHSAELRRRGPGCARNWWQEVHTTQAPP